MNDPLKLCLVRHPPVSNDWHGRCYGRSDVPLDSGWMVPPLPNEFQVETVWSSGLRRCDELAVRYAAEYGVPVHVDTRLQERDFGSWEGRTWNDIFQETGDEMLKMITQPTTWAPPGGETTLELQLRILAWLADVQSQSSPNGLLVVSHGGPIAALRGSLLNEPVSAWPRLIPKPGEIVILTVARSQTGSLADRSSLFSAD